jgi:polyhydroxybutyrate depolymerase
MMAVGRRMRRATAFAAGLAGALVLTACGSAGAATSTGQSSTATAGVTTAATATSRGTTAVTSSATAAATSSATPASSSSAVTQVAVPHASSASGPDGTRTLTITSGGHTRTFLLDVPSGAGPHPLVLVYHGATDTAANTIGETDFSTLSTEKGWIIAYPQGYQDTWNEGAGNTPAHAAGYNDVVFTQQILRYVEAHYTVDRRRIAAVGLSNGALLTELLGCRIASQLTLIVPIEGQLPVSVSPGCRPSRPVSVFEIHGTADTTIPYGGGHFDGVGGGTTVLSAPASVRRWATLDGCRTGSSAQTSGSSTLTSYPGCGSGVAVTLDTIHGGTHEWTPGIAVLVSRQFSAHPARREAATP